MADPKRRPNGIYFTDYTDPDTGTRRRISCETRDLKEARLRQRDILAGTDARLSRVDARQAGAPAPSSQGPTVRELLEACRGPLWPPHLVRSQATVKSHIKLLCGWIGDEYAVAMTDARLLRFSHEMRAMGYAEGSIKRKLDILGKALRTLTKAGEDGSRPLLAKSPEMPEIVIRNIQERIIEPFEEVAIFAAIEARRQAEPGRQWWRFERLIRVLLGTGFRLGEALALGPASVKTVNYLDPASGGLLQGFKLCLPRYTTKSDKPREVPAVAVVVAEMEALNGQAVGGRWFPIRQALAWYMWDTIRKDVGGLDDVKLHTMRHTCLTRLVRGGMPIDRVSRWAGHSNINITMDRYVHMNTGDLMVGLAILDGREPVGPTRSSPTNSFRYPANEENVKDEKGLGNRANLGTVGVC
jgi:integrase